MDKPVRVLQVLASLNRGGAETMIMNLYKHIDRNKLQFDFVVNYSEEKYAFKDEIELMGGRVFFVPRYRVFNALSYMRAWIKLFKENPEWKIIHGHHTSTAFIYLSIANKMQLRTIAHSHIAGGTISLKYLLKKISRYPLRFIATNYFSCSESAGIAMFGKRIVDTKKNFILKNAIDSNLFSFNEKSRRRIRREFDCEDKFVIGHVGRFQKQKNHDFLIDVFNEVYKHQDNARLLLVGEGELLSQIKNKVEKLNIKDKVIFTGVRSDIPNLLQAMDVFVFPSLYEGLGIVAIEAQAAGLPTIVSDVLPEEANVSDLFKSLSLRKSAKEWGDIINEYDKKSPRSTRLSQIKAAGYDIQDTSKWLEKFYLENHT